MAVGKVALGLSSVFGWLLARLVALAFPKLQSEREERSRNSHTVPECAPAEAHNPRPFYYFTPSNKRRKKRENGSGDRYI
jgi:hypothetical protein